MDLKTGLPIEAVIPEVRRALSGVGLAVLEAPPGAGKTTVVPIALLNEGWLADRRIVMLEPRRLAARAAASRMSSLLGEDVGRTVGYRTRLDSRVGPNTKIEVVTEGILTRFLQADPALEGVGAIIFDEFHERSIHADLGLALTLEARSLLREDLRVLVMSATIDTAGISALLGSAPVVSCSGRAFPVEVRYLPKASRPERALYLTGPEFISRVTGAILSSLNEGPGSVLVFLPGASEIKRAERALKEKALPPYVDIMPLYGDLGREAQDEAIRPSGPGRRKVVLATSIAETSITIDGVSIVIDGGLKRAPRFSLGTGMERLETIRVTRDSSDQRKGRAGRTGPGLCMRLWTEDEDRTIKEKSTPEILEADLAPLALELSAWGVKDPSTLKWLDPPPPSAMSQAKELLARLGAIDGNETITPHGNAISRLPLHPRLGHMVVKGAETDEGGLACLLSALLMERDIFKDGKDTDLRQRLHYIMGESDVSLQADRGVVERVRQSARQIERVLNIKKGRIDVERTGGLLALAYPDRIGKRREGKDARFLLANGRGAYIKSVDALSTEEYIVAASLDGGDTESAVFLAAPIKESEILKLFADDMEKDEGVSWDQSQKAVTSRRRVRYWGLTLRDEPLKGTDRAKVLSAFLSGVRENRGVLDWDRASEGLRARVAFLRRAEGGAGLPDLSDDWLFDNLDEWLGERALGMTRLEELKKIDLNGALLSLLSWEDKKKLDELTPASIKVPSGSVLRIDYSGERPVLAVKLQEMFGCEKAPAVLGGKVPLLIHLLSPAGRPLQVTDDLKGFWKTSYELVKKEMKGRYPKHRWPDDPLEAEPTRRVKHPRK
ncbi:MAG: ATP-dependent helicase HrpB [Deltaproteobacteria bacterium GWB2_55_19]|nr:MAG: ATP-dependent helicase HrpB [Deltaproteobacteria bacterium GWB2_55_19]HAO93026.1 ATP-dependent helicase HrpB [Deltaproteobacteria bacterium]